MDTEKQGTGNAENKKILPIVQIACTHSEHPADNLICLQSIIGFLSDSVVAIGCYTDFDSGTADGMNEILKIVSHDLGVMASQIPIGFGDEDRRKYEYHREKGENHGRV